MILQDIHFNCKTQHKTNPNVSLKSSKLVQIQASISKQYRLNVKSYLRYHDRRLCYSFPPPLTDRTYYTRVLRFIDTVHA
ncbi:hypothetical protein AB205_0178350 [Aquarana catesbeiana]|uniref:Uncharacterized protein n=1 Tax=Aquarana catesbeiana TaxID=8400 RepID=A0A2G9RHU9_AQUCT|nr:hypothetical protein AB205_0178350 [Aquarana catesbeiana]